MQRTPQGSAGRREARGTERSRARRAELLAVGRKLFADTAYDVLSMDDIAQQADVAKGLIYYYFSSKRGYYLAVIQDAIDDLLLEAATGQDQEPADRAIRTVEGYLAYAEANRAAFRTVTRGGIGFDAEVQALRDGVHDAIITTIAETSYGSTDIPPLARLALRGWLCSAEGVALDWTASPGDLTRVQVRDLLVRTLGDTLASIELFDPALGAPARPAHLREA